MARVNGEVIVENGRERKQYVHTKLGTHILDAEAARMQSLAAVARMRSAENQA